MLSHHFSLANYAATLPGGEPGVVEAEQWLKAIINDTEPLVKPEEAFVVTQILEAIYQSDREGKAVKF